MDSPIDINKDDKTKQPRFSFQYFDEACDFGVENEHGERIRKRKRPGRKPNPPSMEERRQQNRVAQRNFREREQQRRQEREQQRKEYTDELASLRHQLVKAEYECNYLRGWILQLLLANIAQHGKVPQIWIDTRQWPIPHPTMAVPTHSSPLSDTNEAEQLPLMLQLVLDHRTRSILDIKKAMDIADNSSDSCPLLRRAHYARFCHQQLLQQQDNDTTPIPIPPLPPAVALCQNKSIHDLLVTDIVSINTNSQDVRRTFPLWIPNQKHQQQQHQQRKLSSTTDSTDSDEHHPASKQQQQHGQTSPPPSVSSTHSYESQRHLSPPIILHELPPPPPPPPTTTTTTTATTHGSSSPPPSSSSSSSTSSSSTPTTTVSSIKRLQPVRGCTHEPPTLKRPEDLTHMPPTQALHILRLQLKIGSVIGDKIQYALTPTALQRIIPHDVRIDYIPAGSIRDRMIIFQDYFDMDDCFQLLCTHSVFVGGDIRGFKNWLLEPCINQQYWFLSHHLYDHPFDDCHIPEEFADLLTEWTLQQQHHPHPPVPPSSAPTTIQYHHHQYPQQPSATSKKTDKKTSARSTHSFLPTST